MLVKGFLDIPLQKRSEENVARDKKRHFRINCDTSANDFNQHFANVRSKINSKFQDLTDDL